MCSTWLSMCWICFTYTRISWSYSSRSNGPSKRVWFISSEWKDLWFIVGFFQKWWHYWIRCDILENNLLGSYLFPLFYDLLWLLIGLVFLANFVSLLDCEIFWNCFITLLGPTLSLFLMLFSSLFIFDFHNPYPFRCLFRDEWRLVRHLLVFKNVQLNSNYNTIFLVPVFPCPFDTHIFLLLFRWLFEWLWMDGMWCLTFLRSRMLSSHGTWLRGCLFSHCCRNWYDSQKISFFLSSFSFFWYKEATLFSSLLVVLIFTSLPSNESQEYFFNINNYYFYF